MSRNPLQSYPNRLPSLTKPIVRRDRYRRRTQQGFKRCLKYLYWRLIRLQGKPEAIARGLACGVFAGLFPIFGLQTIVGVLLAVLLRGNKIIAAAGTWVSNPLTYVPIYAFNFHVGKWLLNQDLLTDVSLQSWEQVKALGSEIILTLFVGCFAVGLVGGIGSYFLGLWLIRRVRTSYLKYRSRHQR